MAKRTKRTDSSVSARRKTVDRDAAEAAIGHFLDALGFDVAHPALAETPRRVTEAFVDVLTKGYEMDPATAIGRGFPVSEDAPVTATRIPVMFTCPHHLLPAQGFAHVSMTPRGVVPGLARISRLVDTLAGRLVLQEDLSREIVSALKEHLGVRAAVAIIEARHGCVAVEDFGRRDMVIRTAASVGPPSLVMSLRSEIDASLLENWTTSASEPPFEPRRSRSRSASARSSAAKPKKRTSSPPRRRSR